MMNVAEKPPAPEPPYPVLESHKWTPVEPAPLLFMGATPEEKARWRDQMSQYDPENIGRLEFWEHVKDRQDVWHYANHVWNEALFGMAERLLEAWMRPRRGQPAMSVAEMEFRVLGAERTAGTNTDRRRFWGFIQLIGHGIMPTDFIKMWDVESRFKHEVSRLHQLEKLRESRPDDLNNRARYHHMRRRILNGPPSTPHLETDTQRHARHWAVRYIAMGYSPLMMAKLSHWRTKVNYLSKPLPGSEELERDHQSLEYWRHYGIEDAVGVLKPISLYPELPEPLKFPVRVVIGEDNDPLPIFHQAQELYRRFPVHHLVRVGLMAERAEVSKFVIYGEQDDYYDRHEEELFGEVVTVGAAVDRHRLWNFLGNLDRGQTIPTAASLGPPQVRMRKRTLKEIVRGSAEAYLQAGYPPSYVCHLFEFGRGGLTEPVSPQDAQTLRPAEGWHLRPLAYWLDYVHLM